MKTANRAMMRSTATGTQTPIAALAPVDKPFEASSLVVIPVGEVDEVDEVGDVLGEFGDVCEDVGDAVERAIFHPCIAEATIWKLSPAVLVTISHEEVPVRSEPDANVRTSFFVISERQKAPVNVLYPLQCE